MRAEETQRLKKYVEAAIIPRFNTDRRKYPIYAGRLGKHYLDILSIELVNGINEFRDKGGTIQDLAHKFNNPSRIMRMAHTILAGLKANALPLEKQREVILTLLDIVKAMKHGSEFCEDGKNIILSATDISDLLKKNPLSQATRNSSRLVQQFCGVLWAYAETPYFVCHGIAMEAHGPYKNPSQRKEMILIRDFFNLRPTDLWQECGQMPFEKMRVTTVHDDMDVWFDAFDNLYIRKGNLVDSCRSFSVLAEDEPLSLNQISELCETLNNIILSITNRINSWSEKEIAAKYMEIFWYQIKPLKEVLGKEWHPPQIVLDRVKTKEIPPHSDEKPTKEALRERMSLI